jgi:chorismate dehydratase
VRVPASLRLGCVKYINARPLIHGWPGVVRYDHPSTLCGQLAAGELNVALVSSFEFLRNPVYAIVDGICIASDGAVFSVILAHAGPLNEVREIVVDPASLTSVNLTRVLFPAAKFVRQGEITPQSAALLIGDQAIEFRKQSGGRQQILDLGAEWKARTGLPFVYALWLIRPEYPEKLAVAEALRSLGQENLRNLPAIIAAQPATERAFCEYYYRECLHFSFGEAEKRGLQKFGELCTKRKLLPENPPAFVLV